MRHYKRLTQEEREKILYFSAKDYYVKKIAKELGRNKSTISIELRQNGEPLRSITPNCGKDLAKHEKVMEALEQVKFYFPLPHHPWERGTNENINGYSGNISPRKGYIVHTGFIYTGMLRRAQQSSKKMSELTSAV